MTYLYNCRHAGDQYRITKFDHDLNPINGSSYLCTIAECQCPAGQRPMCRHREMLPAFFQRGHVGDEWMYDYDRGGWVQCDLPSIEYEDSPPAVEPIIESKVDSPITIAMPPTRR